PDRLIVDLRRGLHLQELLRPRRVDRLGERGAGARQRDTLEAPAAAGTVVVVAAARRGDQRRRQQQRDAGQRPCEWLLHRSSSGGFWRPRRAGGAWAAPFLGTGLASAPRESPPEEAAHWRPDGLVLRGSTAAEARDGR